LHERTREKRTDIDIANLFSVMPLSHWQRLIDP